MELMQNLQPSPPDFRDYVAKLESVDALPTAVDLKPDVFEVEHQGGFGSCTANAGCSALELMYKKSNKPVDLSRLFVYWYSRQIGNITGDNGAYPRDLCKALSKYGTCYEKEWQYLNENLNKEPTADLVTKAAEFKILSYEQLDCSDKLEQIKTALAQGIPVLLTIQVHDEFNKLSGSWKSHTWNWTTSDTNPLKGWHEVLVIGYDDETKRLLVENSWGANWADGGFFGIPYEMITSSAFGETWIVRPNFDIAWNENNLDINQDKNTSSAFTVIMIFIIVASIYFMVLHPH